MFPLLCVENGPVKRTGELGRNQTIFNTGKTPVSSVRARCFGCGRTERPTRACPPPGQGEAARTGRQVHGWGFGLAHARSALGPAGRKDHSRLPYLKRARVCAIPMTWGLI